MFNRVLSLLILLCICAPTLALADTGVVRGGEHGRFTRLTISTSAPAKYRSHEDSGEGRFRIELTKPLSKLDRSDMFSRLNAGRVRDIDILEGAAVLEVSCACGINVFNLSEKLIVIDIFEVAEMDQPTRYQVSSGLDKEEDKRPIAGRNNAHTSPAIFDLDHSVVERVTRRIATQLTANQTPGPIMREPGDGGFASGFPTDSQRTFPAEPDHVSTDCKLLNQLWEKARSFSNAASMSLVSNPFGSAGGETDLTQDHLIFLIASGLLTEARLLLDSDAGQTEDRSILRHAVAVLSGVPVDAGLLGDPSCNPLMGLLHFLATGSRTDELTDGQLLDLYHTFRSVPFGLQVAVFEKMEALIYKVSPSGFQDLLEHVAQERRLLSSIGISAGYGETKPDGTRPNPDALGAVARGLRGTAAEEESVVAAFAAYLSDRRYFDAVAALKDMDVEKQAESRASLLVNLAEGAEPITFLAIAGGQTGENIEQIPVNVAQHLMSRFLREGFPDMALDLFASRSDYRVAEGMKLLAGRAYLASGQPQAALTVLDGLSNDGADGVRAEALAKLRDHSAAMRALPDSEPSGDTLRWAWLGGAYDTMAEADTVYAPVAQLLAEGVPDSDRPITVAVARDRLDRSALIRERLADLMFQESSR